MVLKLTWKFSLFARNQKILPSNSLFLFGISCLEIQNFWSPKQHRKGFRISDPQRIQRTIPNFWSPKNTTKDSEFLIPQRFRISDPLHWHTKGFRNSDPLQRHKSIQNFWSFKGHRRRFSISDPPRNIVRERIQNFWSPAEQARIPNFLSPKNIVSSGIGISDHPNNLREKKNIFFSLGSKQSQNLRLKSLLKDSGVNWRLITNSTT